jgi:hypothetical protein
MAYNCIICHTTVSYKELAVMLEEDKQTNLMFKAALLRARQRAALKVRQTKYLVTGFALSCAIMLTEGVACGLAMALLWTVPFVNELLSQ